MRPLLRAFLDSPGHARNLLLPNMTHVGIGVSGRYFSLTFAQIKASPNGTPIRGAYLALSARLARKVPDQHNAHRSYSRSV